ncbi:MAG: prefoldin subunit alpha [ANME-2 cluster archaeon]|nr:prefoldin subunit alpha [ANME-2 cluster archaeon]
MASKKPLSEQDVQNFANQHRQMQYQAEAAIEQLNFVNASINEIITTINTLAEFESVEDGHEVLIPIGAGTNVKAKLVMPENVNIQVGAGISVEKNIVDAKSMLETRKDEMTKYQENIQASVNDLTNKMAEIEKVLASVAGQQQAPPSPPMQGS